MIYYVSHTTSYKTFDDRKTDKLLVFEITLDEKNIVQKYKKYSDKDSLDIKVSRNNDDNDIDLTSFWKDLIRALRRTNNVDNPKKIAANKKRIKFDRTANRFTSTGKYESVSLS